MSARDRIRLTGSLSESPASAGLSHVDGPKTCHIGRFSAHRHRAERGGVCGFCERRGAVGDFSVLAFANLPPTSAESSPTYREERGTQLVGANRRRRPV